MTHEEKVVIFERSVKKAMAMGYFYPGNAFGYEDQGFSYQGWNLGGIILYRRPGYGTDDMEDTAVQAVIFSFEFAKAFWPSKRRRMYEPFNGWESDGYDGVGFFGYLWQYHLQQLVLSEDRLEYLSRFLDDRKSDQ